MENKNNVKLTFKSFTIACANDQCRKYLDGKCSLWNKPTKDLCRDYVNAIVKALNIAFTGLSSAFTASVREAQRQQEHLIQMERLQPRSQIDPTLWPMGGIIPTKHVNWGHDVIDFSARAESRWTLPQSEDALEAMTLAMESARLATIWPIEDKEKEVKKQLTLKEALDLSILLWDNIALRGYKTKTDSGYYSKVKDMRSACPMCQYYLTQGNDGCRACPLGDCNHSSLYSDWDEAPTVEYRKLAAKALSQRLKDFRAEEFPELKDLVSLEQEKVMLKSNLEHNRKEIKSFEGKIQRAQTLSNTMIDRLQVIGQELKIERDQIVKKLFLCVAGDHNGIPTLYVGYGNGPNFDVVAQLNSDRTFEALSNKDNLASYNEWFKDGFTIDETEVVWKERTYHIDKEGLLESHSFALSSVGYQRIYDFKMALPACNCKDPNVITTEHNNRVVIF